MDVTVKIENQAVVDYLIDTAAIAKTTPSAVLAEIIEKRSLSQLRHKRVEALRTEEISLRAAVRDAKTPEARKTASDALHAKRIENRATMKSASDELRAAAAAVRGPKVAPVRGRG